MNSGRLSPTARSKQPTKNVPLLACAPKHACLKPNDVALTHRDVQLLRVVPPSSASSRHDLKRLVSAPVPASMISAQTGLNRPASPSTPVRASTYSRCTAYNRIPAAPHSRLTAYARTGKKPTANIAARIQKRHLLSSFYSRHQQTLSP